MSERKRKKEKMSEKKKERKEKKRERGTVKDREAKYDPTRTFLARVEAECN